MKRSIIIGAISLWSSFATVAAFSTSKRSQRSLSSLPSSTEYDHDELMNSEAEKIRFDGQHEVFNHNKWLQHRASDRFYSTLFQFGGSPIVKNLIDEVGVLIAVSLGIIFWNEMLVEGYTDFSGIHHDAPFAANSFLTRSGSASSLSILFTATTRGTPAERAC